MYVLYTVGVLMFAKLLTGAKPFLELRAGLELDAVFFTVGSDLMRVEQLEELSHDNC